MKTKIGAFTRPWAHLTYADALPEIAKNFTTCGVMRSLGERGVTLAMSDHEARDAVALAREHGLELLCWLPAPGVREGAEKARGDMRRAVEISRAAGIPHILLSGAPPAFREEYINILKEAAPLAADNGVTIGLKPHGNITATGQMLRDLVEEIGTTGFGLWYDPGNLIFYGGLDPVEEAKPMAEFCVGVCLKDCERLPDGKPNVNLRPGTGLVDFKGCLKVLADAGFDGPMLIECLGGEDTETVNANAAEAKAFLEDVIGSL